MVIEKDKMDRGLCARCVQRALWEQGGGAPNRVGQGYPNRCLRVATPKQDPEHSQESPSWAGCPRLVWGAVGLRGSASLGTSVKVREEAPKTRALSWQES